MKTNVHARLAAPTVAAAAFIMCCLSLVDESFGQPAPEAQPWALRLYVPGPSINKRTGGSVVVECAAPDGVKLQQVLVSTRSESEMQEAIRSQSTTRPVRADALDALIVTYENRPRTDRGIMWGPIQRQKVIQVEHSTLTKVGIAGAPLARGEVALRAYLFRAGELLAKSEPLSVQCVEE